MIYCAIIAFFLCFVFIFYISRHTWATLAKYCEIPEEVISEGLGHSSLEVTRTYLKRFENEKLNKANKIIFDYVFKGNQRLWNS